MSEGTLVAPLWAALRKLDPGLNAANPALLRAMEIGAVLPPRRSSAYQQVEPADVWFDVTCTEVGGFITPTPASGAGAGSMYQFVPRSKMANSAPFFLDQPTNGGTFAMQRCKVNNILPTSQLQYQFGTNKADLALYARDLAVIRAQTELAYRNNSDSTYYTPAFRSFGEHIEVTAAAAFVNSTPANEYGIATGGLTPVEPEMRRPDPRSWLYSQNRDAYFGISFAATQAAAADWVFVAFASGLLLSRDAAAVLHALASGDECSAPEAVAMGLVQRALTIAGPAR